MASSAGSSVWRWTASEYGAVCLDENDEVVPEDTHCEGHSFDNCQPVCVDRSGALTKLLQKSREGGFCRGSGQDMHMDGFPVGVRGQHAALHQSICGGLDPIVGRQVCRWHVWGVFRGVAG